MKRAGVLAVLAAMTVTGGMLAATAADEPAAAPAAGAAAVAPFKARWNEAKVPWLKEAAHYVVSVAETPFPMS